MRLAEQGYKIPTQWEHDPTLQDKYKMTVAMHLAYYGYTVPDRWWHDPAM